MAASIFDFLNNAEIMRAMARESGPLVEVSDPTGVGIVDEFGKPVSNPRAGENTGSFLRALQDEIIAGGGDPALASQPTAPATRETAAVGGERIQSQLIADEKAERERRARILQATGDAIQAFSASEPKPKGPSHVISRGSGEGGKVSGPGGPTIEARILGTPSVVAQLFGGFRGR